jgi:ribonuclease HII
MANDAAAILAKEKAELEVSSAREEYHKYKSELKSSYSHQLEIVTKIQHSREELKSSLKTK